MRFIGIQHRVKFSVEGEARPTRVAILENGNVVTHELPEEQDELDFVLGRFPTQFRNIEPNEDLSGLLAHQIKYRKLLEDEKPTDFPKTHSRQNLEEKTIEIATKVPSAFDGLRSGDTVSMVLGGSGDYLAFALARKAIELGARVIRIPSFHLKRERDAAQASQAVKAEPGFGGLVKAIEKKAGGKAHRGRKSVAKSGTNEDHILLARLGNEKPELFYEIEERDRSLILIRESWTALEDAMKARIACQARLRQHFIGNIFTSPDGLYPEGGIEKAYAAREASDVIFGALVEEEKKRDAELEKALRASDVYRLLFSKVTGVGPRIAGRIISAVIDIRRFETPEKLKAFMGVHVLPDGRFPRRRGGEVANWHGDTRQALYLLAEQFNRRPGSEWGKRLRTIKEALREKHPVPVQEEITNRDTGEVRTVSRYSDGHIHKMAMWRTMTKFAEWLYREWRNLEREGRLRKAA